MLHKIAEEGRVGVRHGRQEANKQIKAREAKHEISEDDARREMDQVQKLLPKKLPRFRQLSTLVTRRQTSATRKAWLTPSSSRLLSLAESTV